MAAIDLGGMAFVGFETYKTVQLSSGGSVQIDFPGKDGKTAPPQPLAPGRRVAVWPGDEGDVDFAQKLQSSGKFETVVGPASVGRILADAKQPSDLKQMTDQEQSDAFSAVCRSAKVDLVFGSRSLGTSSNTNSFSMSRATVTAKADLLGYSCAQHTIVWRDQIALVMNLGGNSTQSSSSELNQAVADAWADRVFEAMGQVPALKSS
jgi:hypothetical protein